MTLEEEKKERRFIKTYIHNYVQMNNYIKKKHYGRMNTPRNCFKIT